MQRSEKPYFFAYSTLKTFQQKNRKSNICQESIEDVDISLLIEGVATPEELKEEQNGDIYNVNGDLVLGSKGNRVEVQSDNNAPITIGDGNDTTQNNPLSTPQPTIEPPKEEPTPWYKAWWFVSLMVSLIGGGVSWLTFSSLGWGLGIFAVIFLVMVMNNPKRRFFRLGVSTLIMGVLQFTPISGLIKIPENSFLYGHLQINSSDVTYLGLLLVVLSGFLFWLDSKER
ncbi:MAG: hypothetical protein JXQ76_12440 [Campylobacterales bacterium]|nr:hypothetical protein [Campylobacterales bacterium]